jgi:hypothetical protein
VPAPDRESQQGQIICHVRNVFLATHAGKAQTEAEAFFSFTCRTQSRGEQDAVAYRNGKNGCGRPRTCDRPGVLYVRVVVSCPRGA